ncbi:hypothetical protein SAMN06265222_105231 [Neorhodopirellula lusitana]|uniref:Lipoprotein n=1 Tax=Neorhodopirellula lusitana TaxID=445327 RepID=A0ABY1Q227_9BACT|nr:hypothetical protein [Neorhodopirellula lusitana]SMP56930.1 hypothetical protein SAMN06265222_105231 [Neorhodopirellula lusitana]
MKLITKYVVAALAIASLSGCSQLDRSPRWNPLASLPWAGASDGDSCSDGSCAGGSCDITVTQNDSENLLASNLNPTLDSSASATASELFASLNKTPDVVTDPPVDAATYRTATGPDSLFAPYR